MKKVFYLLAGVILFFPFMVMGKGSTKIMRGGSGILFPDHNLFSNPGQFSITYGVAFETSYQRVNASDLQTLIPSFVFGNGKFGIGAYGSRIGTNIGLSESSTDSIGSGLGISLFKQRLTVGVGYDRSVDASQSSDGNASLSLAMNAAQRKGPSVGLVFGSSINQEGRDQQRGTFGLGYSFASGMNFEINLTSFDISNSSNYGGAAYLNLGSQVFYLGSGYEYINLSSQHYALARLGVIIGRYIDLSVYSKAMLRTDGSISYGATFRTSF